MRDTHYEIINNTERDHWRYRVRRELVGRLVRDVANRHGGPLRVLDVGCGTGLVMKELAQFGDVSGIDMSEHAVAYCNARGLSPVLSSAEQMPFADNSFDVVVMLDVLEHIDEYDKAAREVARVPAPDGTLIITVPAFEFLWGVTDEVSHHYRRYTRSTLVRHLAAAGLRANRATYFNTLLFPAIAAVRLTVRALRIPMRSENTVGGNFANKVLYAIFSLEPRLLSIMNFSFGVSVLAIASKTTK